MKNYEFIPGISVGPFKFGSPISTYLDKYICQYYPAESEVGWESYVFKKPLINVYTENGLIHAIKCEKFCIIGRVNIIGMDLISLVKTLGVNYDFSEKIFIDSDDGYQDVFDFDKFGLQVWVVESKVVTVFCSKIYE